MPVLPASPRLPRGSTPHRRRRSGDIRNATPVKVYSLDIKGEAEAPVRIRELRRSRQRELREKLYVIFKSLILRGYRCTIFLLMEKRNQSRNVELPTPGELALLQVLWRIREGTIEDILMAAGGDPPPNYKTVQAWLRIMERKGQVEHRQEGRAFVFRPLISRGDVHRLSFRHFLAKYFTGSREELLVELLSDERISPEELRQLESLVRNRRKELL